MKKPTEQEIRDAIAEFSKGTSRQRNDLYEFLNDKLGVELKTRNYSDARSNEAKFSCNDEKEVDYVVKKILDM